MSHLSIFGDWQEMKPRVRQALKATIAACLSFIIADSMGLPQAFWAAVVAIVVTQASIGASLGHVLDWFMGSVIGAIVGGVVAVLVGPGYGVRVAGLAVTVLVMAYFAASRPHMRIACVTATIIILGTPMLGTPMESAGIRIVEVIIGTTVATLTMLLVYPARAGPALADHIRQTLPLYFQLICDLLDMTISGSYDADKVKASAAKIRAAIATNEELRAQAQREVSGHLGDSPDPEALLTAIRRLWHTELILARVVSQPLPKDVLDLLRGGLEKLRDAIAALGTELTETAQPMSDLDLDTAEIEAAIAKLNQTVDQMRGGPELRALSTEELLRLMTLDFALEQLRQSLKDLVHRRGMLTKLAGSRIPWRQEIRRLLKVEV
ncbi:MAG: hypothetical protein CMK33_03395 [Porticoccaceae bacterium]|nr:hypothetical protein [Porticoccaceae bacterium]